MSYRLHIPLRLRDPLGLFYQMCVVFTVWRGISIKPHLLIDLHNLTDIKLCWSAVLCGHWSLFWFRLLHCFFSLIPPYTILSFLPLSAVFYKAWIWKFHPSFADYKHLQRKPSYFHSHSSLSCKCYSFIPYIYKRLFSFSFFIYFYFFCSWKDRKRTEEYYWKFYSNYQIAELVTLPTGNNPDL